MTTVLSKGDTDDITRQVAGAQQPLMNMGITKIAEPKGDKRFKVIDYEAVRRYARAMRPLSSIAVLTGISVATLERRCADIILAEYEKTRLAIAEEQIKRGLAGNDRLLVFLGKQYLGQTDKLEATGTIAQIVVNVSDIPL